MQKVLRPVTRYPPSTVSALVIGQPSEVPASETATQTIARFVPASRRSNASWRQRDSSAPIRAFSNSQEKHQSDVRCMLRPMAVEGSARANRLMTMARSCTDLKPNPRNSSGTQPASRRLCLIASQFSNGKVFSRSCASTLVAKSAAWTAAKATN